MPTNLVVDVKHDCQDGWHTFTSDHIPGLFLTVHEANLEAAFHEIPQVIEHLIRLDYGREASVQMVALEPKPAPEAPATK